MIGWCSWRLLDVRGMGTVELDEVSMLKRLRACLGVNSFRVERLWLDVGLSGSEICYRVYYIN